MSADESAAGDKDEARVPTRHLYSPTENPIDPHVKAKLDRFGELELAEQSGISLDRAKMTALLRRLAAHYDQLPFVPTPQPGLHYHYENTLYSYGDAIILGLMMLEFRPRRIIEVGSGFSSFAMIDVNEMVFGGDIELTFVEPNPERFLERLPAESRYRARLHAQPVQSVSLEIFRELEANDILFVDSTHVSNVASDLNHLVFNVFPVLKPGVLIHVQENRSWNEAYLLRAFLQFNHSFEVLFFNHFASRMFPDALQRHTNLYLSNGGASIWLQRKDTAKSDKPFAASPAQLDVIVRFHDQERIFELRRAIFALVCQSYRPLAIYLITQRFSDSQIQQVADDLASILAIDQSVTLSVSNYSRPLPADARSALLNQGIRTSSGRYLAFLDHDDTIYPEAYRQLIDELALSRCAVSFGGIAMKDAEVFQDSLLVESRRATFVGSNLIDLFANNFCPIHSFVLDRNLIHAKDLWFDESLSKLEDYDFLLRLCAQYESSFSLIHKVAGDYYIKSDNSNTLTGTGKRSEWIADWNRSVKAIERRKGECVLSLPVSRMLGYSSHLPELTISNLLDRQGRVSATGILAASVTGV